MEKIEKLIAEAKTVKENLLAQINFVAGRLAAYEEMQAEATKAATPLNDGDQP
ncbi:hypothetical protein KGP36_04040 [Patescibacteria group bacterium]|nr:hypothetical protein [Patescibacteria group bacterium]